MKQRLAASPSDVVTRGSQYASPKVCSILEANKPVCSLPGLLSPNFGIGTIFDRFHVTEIDWGSIACSDELQHPTRNLVRAIPGVQQTQRSHIGVAMR